MGKWALLLAIFFVASLLLVSVKLSPEVFQGFFLLVVKTSKVVQGFLMIGDHEPPVYSSPSQDHSTIFQDSSVNLSTYWFDGTGLDYAWLTVDEGYGWRNISGLYGSPREMEGSFDFSNFIWQNNSFLGTVRWRIYANDTFGYENATPVMAFEVLSPTTSSSTTTTPGGGGGGGGGTLKKAEKVDFELNPKEIKVTLSKGEMKTVGLKVTNTGDSNLTLLIDKGILGDFFTTNDMQFSLVPGEARTLFFDFRVSERLAQGVYLGEMGISGGGITKRLPVMMEVKPEVKILDIDVTIPSDSKVVHVGQTVTVNMAISSQGTSSPVEVTLRYDTRDIYGGIFNPQEEKLIIENNAFITRELKLPTDMKEGKYIVYANLSYDGYAVSGGYFFDVLQPIKIAYAKRMNYLILLIILVLIAILAYLIYKLYKGKKYKLFLYRLRMWRYRLNLRKFR